METYQIYGLIALVVMAILGFPIYLSIFACALIILVWGMDIDPIFPMGVMFSRLSNVTLLAIPLFIFLGQILALCGAGQPLIRFLNAFLGHLPGGPAYALIFASVVVAAMCTSPIAAIAGFGPLIVPTLIALGYSETFSIGLLIASASLAPLIPPNTIGIVYSFIASQGSDYISITTVWTGAIIPGLIVVFLLCGFVYFYSKRGHFQKLPPVTWAERWQSLKVAWPVIITPFAVLVPLYAGWATPTEVSAVGLVYVVLISAVFYRGVNPKNLWLSAYSTLRILGAIFLIISAATLLNIAFTYSMLPQNVTEYIADMGLSWWSFMLIMIVVYLIMGMFLDPSAIVLISVPLLLNTMNSLGIDLVVFGVFCIIAVNLAGMTPPYGLTIFASQSIMRKPYHTIVKACIMFLPAIFIGLILVAFIEPLSTWLPDVLDV
ncbi:TRAP transporter large permease [Chloroflexota bacterium]